MSTYEKLLSYIPYFENEVTEFFSWQAPEEQGNGVFNMGYPQYDDEFLAFIKEVYNTDLLNGEYLNVLEEKVKDLDYQRVIPLADKELLTAMLTFYVRQERFCDGAWTAAIKEKVFLSILYRLKELV